ncbi:hypothetical protein CI610_02189 [invertebrate metagenome]|uniref:Uncharacterized protein n=1 Tax=invertebrate metagenome TaxID=1711999 RepID=A0A2H9T6M8_9ZZZZ
MQEKQMERICVLQARDLSKKIALLREQCCSDASEIYKDWTNDMNFYIKNAYFRLPKVKRNNHSVIECLGKLTDRVGQCVDSQKRTHEAPRAAISAMKRQVKGSQRHPVLPNPARRSYNDFRGVADGNSMGFH